MKDFRNLSLWRKAHPLVLPIYGLTAGFPGEERYGLTAQLRRAAVSIGANIAEGCGRHGDAELARFLQIAFGSACEAEYLLFLACDLGYPDRSRHAQIVQQLLEVKKMLASLIRKLTAECWSCSWT